MHRENWDPLAKYRREWDPWAKYRLDEDPELPPGRTVYRFVPDYQRHDRGEQTQDSSEKNRWFYPQKTPERIQIDELREKIKTLKKEIKKHDLEIKQLTKQKETGETKIKELDKQDLAILNRREKSHDLYLKRFGFNADVHNIMPRTENDTVNQYFIHTSFGNLWNTKPENEVITELQEEITQLQQRIQEQKGKILKLSIDIMINERVLNDFGA
jgi:hypothetical protein